MAPRKKTPKQPPQPDSVEETAAPYTPSPSVEYEGVITTTGSSQAIRLEKALFRSHPEFKQKAKVRAHVIAPGRLLLRVEPEHIDEDEPDPVLGAYLDFLAKDIEKHPEQLVPLNDLLAKDFEWLKDVEVSDDEVMPDGDWRDWE